MDFQIGGTYMYRRSNEINSGANTGYLGKLCTLKSVYASQNKSGHVAYIVEFEDKACYYLYDAEMVSLASLAEMAKAIGKIKININ